jgi:hypothetical protein
MARVGRIRDSGSGKALRISVEELASQVETLEAELKVGRAIELVRGGTVVAEVRPTKNAPASRFEADPDGSAGQGPFHQRMPDYRAQMREVFGDEVLDVDTATWVAEGRDRDLLL